MRETLLGWLPTDLRRTRVLDAGCGTGSLAVAAACRGAEVKLGTFAHVVAMDSLIHYEPEDLVAALAQLAQRTTGSILFTFAPRTTLLAAMHTVGKAFPKSDRSPAIVPIAEGELRERLARLNGWSIGRTQRISSGFYTSQALELVRHG